MADRFFYNICDHSETNAFERELRYNQIHGLYQIAVEHGTTPKLLLDKERITGAISTKEAEKPPCARPNFIQTINMQNQLFLDCLREAMPKPSLPVTRTLDRGSIFEPTDYPCPNQPDRLFTRPQRILFEDFKPPYVRDY